MSQKYQPPQQIVYVCLGSKCKKAGNKDLAKKLKKQIKEAGLKGQVEVIRTECTGRCKLAPVCSLQPTNQWYTEFKEEEIQQTIKQEIFKSKT